MDNRPLYLSRALSAIEVLVVLAIIAILLAIIVPALSSARIAAREVTSVATIMNICNEFERGPYSRWLNGQLRGGTMAENKNDWIDPFRRTPVSRDTALAPLGALVDGDFPPSGYGYFYLNFEDLHLQPFGDPNRSLFTNLRLPTDTQYVIIGVGRDGRLDLDVQRDVVLIKTPVHVHLTRHK